MPKTDAAKPDSKPEGQPSAKFKLDELGVLGTVLAAIGSGLGILGLVAFFGAAILWVRMDEAGLPANETLAIVPRSSLVATGASFLVPALLVALGFAVLLYLIDAFAVWQSGRDVRQLRDRVRDAKRQAQRLRRRAEVLEGVTQLAMQNHSRAAEAHKIEAISSQEADKEEEAFRTAAAKEVVARQEATDAEKKAAELEQEMKRTAPSQEERTERIRTTLLVVLTVLLFVFGTIWMLDHYSVSRSDGRSAVLALTALVLITFCVVVRLRTNNFGWFAAAAFLAVGTMSGVVTYYRTLEDPKIEPAAVLRSKAPPIYGFYVAQTSDRVYLGTETDAGGMRLHEIPRDEVLELAVGSLQPPELAEETAQVLAHQLCLAARERKATGEIVGEKGGGKAGEEVAHGCTAEDLAVLVASSPKPQKGQPVRQPHGEPQTDQSAPR